MKTNCWLILGTMIATTAVAQVNTNKLPEIPPPAIATPAAPASVVVPAESKTIAPVKKAAVKAKKKTVKKTSAPAKPVAKKMAELGVPLVPGSATVTSDNVNLRGQAGLLGEVVGQVKKGDTVNVLSEIILDKPKADEPMHWAKISLPTGTKVWINSRFVDASNKVVTVKKLNLRGGPGENFSVLGVVEKGTSVTEITSKGDWTQIETPTSAFAFMAAAYLKQGTPVTEPTAPVAPVVAAVQPVAPTPTTVTEPTTTVAEPQPVAPPANVPATPETTTLPATPAPAPTPAPAITAMNVPPPPLEPDVDTNPPPPRIVTHEGSVRPSVSPVAPTTYELFDPANDKAINYLYTTSTNLNLHRYNGLHITVTGEEGMESRWQDTPVLTIQKIYVLSGDTPKPSAAPLRPVKNSWFGK